MSQPGRKWIEFIGPPGSGKSTLAQGLNSNYAVSLTDLHAGNKFAPTKLRHNLSRAFNQLFKIVAPLYRDEILTNYPGILVATHSMLNLYEDGERMYRHAMEEWARLGYAINHLSSDEIYVGDDGPYSFYLRLLKFKDWSPQKIFMHLPHPDKFVLVHASSQTCLERQESRSGGRTSRIKHLPRQDALSILEESHDRGKQMINAAERAGIETETICTEDTRPDSISL